MNYGHVGRPTNEEVKNKKRKKMLMICIPIVAIIAIIGVVISQDGMIGMMGNSFDYSKCKPCDKSNGWNEGDNNTCYREVKTIDSQINAFLLGDADYNNSVTYQDLSIISNAIHNNAILNDNQKLIYDLNQDGEINELDIEHISNTSSVPSGEFNFMSKYVCPKNKNYVLKSNKCIVYSTKIETKNAECSVSSSTKTNQTSVKNNDTTSYNKSSATKSKETCKVNLYHNYFDTKGGDTIIPVSVKCGNKLKLGSKKRSGYIFQGWYTKLKGGKKVSDPYKVTKKVVNLYAHWKKK